MDVLEERHLAAPAAPQPRELPELLADILVPGGVAGTLGGLLMGLLAIFISWIFARAPFAPLQLVAGLFLRHTHLEDMGAWAVVLGIFIHMGMATGLGVTFAALLPRGHTAVAAIGWAWLYSMGVYLVMAWIVVQFADPPLYKHLDPGVFFLLHLLYGACLPVVVSVRRAAHRVEALLARLRPWLPKPESA